MNDYKPSDDFVQRVMGEVHHYETAKANRTNWWASIIEKSSVLWCLSSGAALLGLWNIVRIYATLFIPAICR